MAHVKYDVSDVEAGGGGEEPQPGLYAGKIVGVTRRDKKTNGDPTDDLEIVVDIGQEYSRKFTYIQLDNPATAWKLRELTDAVGLPPKGQFDPKSLEGKKVSVRIKADKDLEENYRGSIKNLLKPGSDNGAAPSDSAAADDDYSTWSTDDLVAEIEERGLDVPSGRKTVAKLASILEEHDAEQGGGDGSAEDTDTADEYDSWTDEDLKAEVEERGIAGNISGRKSRDKLLEALRADDGGPGGGAEDPEEGPTDDYDDWSQSELESEVQDRNKQGSEIKLTGRKSKEKLIEALRADDASEPF